MFFSTLLCFSPGSNQFIGRMWDFRFYPATLTNREIVQLYSGVLPKLHVQSECRCPPSHPRVHPLVERYCIPNAVEDTTNDRVLRLNLNAHPLSYINDQDMGTMWLSKVMSLQELDEGVTVTVDLANGQYQVMQLIHDNFMRSETVILLLLGKSIYQICDFFFLCFLSDILFLFLALSDLPLSGGNITFSLLTAQPHLRPGYNDFYKTPALQEMVLAAQVRIHMKGQYHTGAVGVNQLHRHFAISEITISGRCECHGHADQCDTSVTPYRCLCLPESHTVGNNCEYCAPLYNDKPFRAGDQLQPMNCRLCQCYGHAVSCHYDVLADEHPDEHYRGGGGVCDHCMHNTTGKNCEYCISGFFRQQDSDPSSAHVCQPCKCNAAGTVKGNTECAQVGGQCNCKAAVTGRECAHCLPGWYGLNATNPHGCTSCNCSDQGTVSTFTGAVSICNQYTGQCQCKQHVTGLSCDRCEFGYWNLSHPDGCIPCDCDPLGSLSSFCEPDGGQCECKPGVGGRQCDSCGRGLYGLRLEGSCAPCNCSRDGTVPGTNCDPYTGQCVCKVCTGGHHCDSCRHGYHTLEQRNSLGCLPCVCDISGTVSQGVCDMKTGQCPCKEGVEGAHCTSCVQNYYNRLSQGCVPCICDPRGTVTGSTCDSTTGQCVCIPSRHGKDCSSCRPGECQPCACDPVGSVNSLCHPDTGVCMCKLLVTGDKCDSCQPGASHFDPENPFGCSKGGAFRIIGGNKSCLCVSGSIFLFLFLCTAPSQQPAPIGLTLSYSSIHLSWYPPDSPNSHRLNYTLLRDGQPVHTIQRQFPFSMYQPSLSNVSFSLIIYIYIYTNVAGETISPVIHYTGLSTEAVASGLKSFTQYSVTLEVGMPRKLVTDHIHFILMKAQLEHLCPKTNIRKCCPNLQACASGGCTSSPPLSLLTAAAPPQNQSVPSITATGPHTLHASWEPPSQPNGIPVFLRGPLEANNVSAFNSEKKVFSSSGWLDPSVFPEGNPTKRNMLSPPESSTIIEGLQAFSAYQLRVVSINRAGNATSEWTTAHTLEGENVHVLLIGSYLNEFSKYLSCFQVLHRMGGSSLPVHIVEGLEPYHVYNFTVTLCTRMGCITSLPSTGRTLPAGLELTTNQFYESAILMFIITFFSASLRMPKLQVDKSKFLVVGCINCTTKIT
uniref:Usher syndrome 2A (autosomal recessive, mild) n=1 Tax=Fundulus heteroclitus TaxID=8078 RepID=A0A3Q2PWV5_FUNHE